MKLKLQVVLIPVTLAEMPTSSIATFKKFLHLTDPESSVGQVCDALIKRYNRLYPEADKLQVEGIQDDDRCDLDPDFAASDVFQSGDVVRVLVDNLLPTYSRDTSMILPDVTTATADATTSSKRRADSSEANDSRMLKKSRTIWGIRQDSPSEAAETAPKAVPTNELVTKSPVLLPPPSHQTPGSKIIPQKKPSPASSSGRRITSGMLKLPDDSEHSTESVKKTPQAVSQSPEHDEIDDGTDSDDLVSHRLLKHRKENDKNQATKLAPPPTVPTKTPSKKEPLNTLTPYHSSTQPPQPQANASQAPPITQVHQQQHFQPLPPLQQAARQQYPVNSSAANNNGWQPTQTRLPQPQFPELQRPKQVGSQMKLMHTFRQGTAPASQFSAALSPHQYGQLPHMQHSVPPQHQNQTLQSPYVGSNISHPSLAPQYVSPSGSFQSHLSPAPGPQPQLPVQRPPLSSSPAAPVQNTTQHQQHRNTSLLENSLIRQYPVTSPIEDQKMQESIKQLIHEKVDDAMRRQEYLVKQGVGKIREEEEKEKERKTAEDRRRDEEQRRMQEEMRKAEENRILMPAEELKRQAELLEQEQEWRDRTLLFQKHLQQKEELLKKKEALRQQEVRKEAILRKQDDLRRQAELKKQVERKQEEALRQQEQTKAKALQEKNSSQGKGPGENLSNNSQAQGKAPPVHVFDYDKSLPSNVMKPATGYGGLTPTVVALPQPEPRVNNTNGSTATKEGSGANKASPSSGKVAHGHKEDVSLDKGEIMSIIRNNMRVPHKIIKKLSVPTPDNAKFAAHEEERKRQIREENIARNAAELESRRRNAAAAPPNTTRSLRSRVTIGGVPNFDTNLDNIEDEKEKEKEKLKETRANALPAPFNDFASKSKLSSIYVKMKKLDARIEKQHLELPKKIKSEPSTPSLQRTEDASQLSNDTSNGQQSTLQKLQAAAEDESDEENDASEKDGGPEEDEEEEEEEEETNASSQSSEDDIEMQDAAAVSNSSEEDASINEFNGSEDEESEDVDSDSVGQPKKKVPEQTKPRAIEFANQTPSSIPGIVKRGRGRPRKDDPRNLTKKLPQPRASLRTRSAAPEVIELESSSENTDGEGSDDNAEQIEDEQITTEDSNQVSVGTSAFETSENKKPLNATEQTSRESSEAVSGYNSQRSESHYTDAEASDVRGREISYDHKNQDGEAASDPIEVNSKAGTEVPEAHGDKMNSANEGIAKETGLASSRVEDHTNVTHISSHATTASSSPSVAADPVSSKLSQAKEDANRDDSVKATVPKKVSPEKASKAVASLQSAPASQKTDASPTKKVTASMLVAALNKLPKSKEGQKVGSKTPVSKTNTSKRASYGEGLSPIKKPRLESPKVDGKAEDGENEVKPDVVISSNSESESSSSSSSSSSSESESSSESSSESDSENESNDNASHVESKSQKTTIVATGNSDGNNIAEKTDEKSHLSNLEDTGSKAALVSKETLISKEEPKQNESFAEKKSASGEGSTVDKKPATSKEKKPVVSKAASSSSSNSSSDSDSDSSEDQSLSESESEAKKKTPTIAKNALKKVPSLVSSRVVKKNFGSLAKPTAKPIKAPSPPVHKLSEGVRTITIETPFSKSSDEDEKAKANKAQQRPAPTATLPKLNSLSDLQKRGVPDVRDSKDKSSSDSKKQPEKKPDTSESELESLSDSELSSGSDSDLDLDSSDDEDSSKFASLKKLSGDRDSKKKKKKSIGFSSLMRDANKK